MQNQIYRGVQHDAKSQQNNQSNSNAKPDGEMAGKFD